MGKLVAISPVGKNGQTVVPAPIRKMFRIAGGRNLVGFYVEKGHVEIAPVSVAKSEVEYTEAELNRLGHLAKEQGGRAFKSADKAKKYLKEL